MIKRVIIVSSVKHSRSTTVNFQIDCHKHFVEHQSFCVWGHFHQPLGLERLDPAGSEQGQTLAALTQMAFICCRCATKALGGAWVVMGDVTSDIDCWLMNIKKGGAAHSAFIFLR